MTADVSAGAADVALETLAQLTVPAEDIALARLDRIAPLSAEAEPLALVWADLLGQARVNSRTAVRYLVFMAVAGLVAAFGVIDNNQILIVGAMAVSPDLLQTHVNSETLLVALAAGVAGMLALETRASAAVGVAISVTTIPASAFLGIAAGIGGLSESLSALGVLGATSR